MRRAGLIGILFATACLPSVDAAAPTVDGARTVFWTDLESGVQAAFPADEPTPDTIEAHRFALRYFPWDLDELLLEPGPYVAPEGELQPAPAPLATFVGAPSSGVAWTETTPQDLPELELPRPDPERCLSQETACIPGDEPFRCADACAVSTPAAPELPRLICDGEGWQPAQTDGAAVCAPPTIPVVDHCPAGALRPGPGAACEAFACAAGRWPDATSVDAIFVDATAAPDGDGSSARPFSSLSEAWAAADDGAEILLAEGEYDANLTLSGRAVTVRGLCPVRTLLDGAPSIRAAGALALRDLSVRLGEASIEVEDGRLELDAVELSGARDLVIGQRGEVAGHRVLSASADALGFSVSEVHLQLSEWEHWGERGLTADRSALEVSNAWLHGSGQSATAIGLTTATATISTTWVHGCRSALSAQNSAFVLEDFGAQDIRYGIYGASANMTPTQARLTRVFVLGAEDRGVQFDDMNAEIHQLTIDTLGTALQFDQVEATRLVVEMNGIWLRSAGNGVLRFGSQLDDVRVGQILVDGADWVIQPKDPEKGVFSLRVRNGPVLTVERLLVVGGQGGAGQFQCADAQLRDLTVIAGRAYGFSMQPLNRIELERAAFSGKTATDIEVLRFRTTCEFGSASFTDVAWQGCPECERAVRLARGARVEIVRSAAAGFVTGFEVESLGDLRMTDSASTDNQIGVSLPEAHDVEAAVRQVHFARNHRNLERTQ